MRPHNALPIGSRILSAEGYYRIKTAESQSHWPLEHRVLWEAAHGTIPPGATLHHVNEIKTDNRLENLRLCATEAEHQRLYHRNKLVERNVKGLSPESIAKMAATKRGRKLTPEHRAKIGAALIGRGCSAETRAKLSAIHTGRFVSEEWRRHIGDSKRGIHPSAETRAKISAATRGRSRSAETIERMKAAQQKRAADMRKS